jgi:hypothetical protein
MSRTLPLIFLFCVIAACEVPEPATAPAMLATVDAPKALAYLTVSDSNGSVGSTLVAAGDVSLSAAGAGVGSFTVRVRFDPAALAFVEDVPGTGMMRAINAKRGEVVIAGASGAPVADPRLFAIRFRVLRTGGVASLSLQVDEMNNGQFESQLPSLHFGAVHLDRTLK